MTDSTNRQEICELERQLWCLKNLTAQTYTAAKQAEQKSRTIGQVSLARKLLDIQRQVCVLQLTLKDSEIQDWTGTQMQIPL
ncbi:hypothetical protein [Acaryochloris sp. CCMEE 5410]|uniref:hypothetical protein n=1 Tax=Acaryochloris sp. CCMEE 5410 TaxID=310037 RepID=UPI0002484D0A|nr:hypothetical protein [Acaryochloris sp. CCMEE 5410]KAI9129088.1 hypothetical protein ON05_036650 [Acaryochloris sp. CCMEE 5410]